MKEKSKNKKRIAPAAGLKFASGLKTEFTPGFTLVEALVAVSIILVGVTAAFGTAQLGLSSTSAVRNRITATFLVQEALEGVKNIKDSNLQKISLNNDTRNWLAGISDGGTLCLRPNGCGYDVINDSLTNCDAMNGCKIKIETQTNGDSFYRQMDAPGNDTGFIRKIVVEETAPGFFEAKVTVEISRSTGNFPTFTVVSLLHNWF